MWWTLTVMQVLVLFCSTSSIQGVLSVHNLKAEFAEMRPKSPLTPLSPALLPDTRKAHKWKTLVETKMVVLNTQ